MYICAVADCTINACIMEYAHLDPCAVSRGRCQLESQLVQRRATRRANHDCQYSIHAMCHVIENVALLDTAFSNTVSFLSLISQTVSLLAKLR